MQSSSEINQQNFYLLEEAEKFMTLWNASNVTKYYAGKIGAGIKANGYKKAGSTVLYFHGPVVPGNLVKDFDLALQVGEDSFMESAGDVDDFANHSCSPNTVIVNRYHAKYGTSLWCLVAIRDIESEEPVTFDYSSTMSGGAWSMKCECGSRECRGIISDFADLDKTRQEEILKARCAFSGRVD